MLTEKEAFQMILDTIFKSEPVLHTCTNDNADPETEVNKFMEYISPILKDLDKRVSALENNNKPVKSKTTAKKKETKNSLKSTMKSRNPTDVYTFPECYKTSLNWELKNDGTVGSVNRNQGKIESFTLLKLFKKIDFPIKNEDYSFIKKTLEKESISLPVGMSIIYNLGIQLGRGEGLFIDIIHSIFSNEYSVPAFLNFKVQNNQITINNVETGIKPFQVKQWIDEIKLHEKWAMIKIMKENSHLSQKYLWFILNYYNRKELLEVL